MIIDCISDLIPCPFCKSKNLRISKEPKISQDLQYFSFVDCCVECLNCGADGPKIAFVDDVKKAWNARIKK